MTYKVYTELNHYNKNHRGFLFELLRPYVKDASVSHEELEELYGSFVNKYELTNNLNESDFAVLPMAWEYYYITNQRRLLAAYVANIISYGKEIFTQTCGDFGVTPLNKNVIVLRANGYQSRRLNKQHALPAFISCPIKRVFKRNEISLREKTERPVIGFCGQAVTSPLKNATDIF